MGYVEGLDWIFFVAGLLSALYIYATWNNDYFTKRGVPALKPMLFLGNMASVMFRRKALADFMVDVYQASPTKFLGVFEFRNPIIVLRDLDLVKQITVKDSDYFPDHRVHIDENSDPIFGRNLFSLKGQKWRDMRATLTPAFTGSKLRGMFGLVDECAEQMTQHLSKQTRKGPLIIEMKELFTRFANDVIATTAFGIKVDSLAEKENEFYRMGNLAANFKALKFFGFTSFPNLMKVVAWLIGNVSQFLKITMIDVKVSNFFRSSVLSTMETRERNRIFRPDMINLLMQARKGTLEHEGANHDDDAGFAAVEESAGGKSSNKREWEDDDIIAQALLFFIAGFDTSSSLMCFTAHELAVNQDIQRRLQAEIDEANERFPKLTYESVQKLEYLDMVISESLRKWPPQVALDRICAKPYVIRDKDDNIQMKIEPGQGIWIPIYAIHRDPGFYPDPETFDPERFNVERKRQIKSESYIPFGTGPRNCIGSRFALMEAKLVIFHMLSHFDFRVCSKTQIPLKLSKKHFLVASEKGFWVELKPRN